MRANPAKCSLCALQTSRVVRMVAKSREGMASAVTFLGLAQQAKQNDTLPELQKLIKLKEELGELSAPDEARYKSLMRASEQQILKVGARRTTPRTAAVTSCCCSN